mgnify:CR=1 FL=1
MQLNSTLQFSTQSIYFFAVSLAVQTIQTLFCKHSRIFRQRFPVGLFFNVSNHTVTG